MSNSLNIYWLTSFYSESTGNFYMPMLIVQKKKKKKPNTIEMYKEEEKVTSKSALRKNLVSIL